MTALLMTVHTVWCLSPEPLPGTFCVCLMIAPCTDFWCYFRYQLISATVPPVLSSPHLTENISNDGMQNTPTTTNDSLLNTASTGNSSLNFFPSLSLAATTATTTASSTDDASLSTPGNTSDPLLNFLQQYTAGETKITKFLIPGWVFHGSSQPVKWSFDWCLIMHHSPCQLFVEGVHPKKMNAEFMGCSWFGILLE